MLESESKGEKKTGIHMQLPSSVLEKFYKCTTQTTTILPEYRKVGLSVVRVNDLFILAHSLALRNIFYNYTILYYMVDLSSCLLDCSSIPFGYFYCILPLLFLLTVFVNFHPVNFCLSDF